jgi:hypothetical protein
MEKGAWPGKTGGAIVFALNFLLLLFFVSRQRKVRNKKLLYRNKLFQFAPHLTNAQTTEQ